LFLLNIALQLFDGVATYQGILTPAGEANPILATAMAHLGLGSTLLLFKAKACGWLVILRRMAGRSFVAAALTGVAAAYGVCSFIPWMVRFLGML
jgi:hypothetical protein